MILLTSCTNDYKKGYALMLAGDRVGALQYFGRVENKDPDYSRAQEYIKNIHDTLNLTLADSNYNAGNIDSARVFYTRINNPDSRIKLRITVCIAVEYFDYLKKPMDKYASLRHLLSDYNLKVFRKFKLAERDASWDLGYYSSLIDLYSTRGNIEHYRGAFLAITSGPWGNPAYRVWHGGYQWDSGQFVVTVRTISGAFDIGVQTLDSYLFSKVEIPKRWMQTFLVQFKGMVETRTEYGRQLSVPRFEIVGVLGYNNVSREERWPYETVKEDFVFTENNLTHCLEQVYSELSR